MKIRSKVYKEVRDRLLAGMPGLFVDLQKGQMSNKSQNYPIPLPACLIEFKQVGWSNTTGGQLGDSLLSFHLFIDHVTDSFNGSEREEQTIALLDKLDELYETMQGCSGEYFSPLNRTTDAVVEYRDRYVYYRMDFQTTLTHNDAPQKTTIKTEPKFKF